MTIFEPGCNFCLFHIFRFNKRIINYFLFVILSTAEGDTLPLEGVRVQIAGRRHGGRKLHPRGNRLRFPLQKVSNKMTC